MDGSIYQRKKKSYFLFRVLIFLILIFLINYLMYILSNKIKESKLMKKTLFDDDFSFTFQIEDVVTDKLTISLEGWLFKLNKPSQEKDMEIHLVDCETGKILLLKNKDKTRNDVNEYFKCEYDYSFSGFNARYKFKKSEDIMKTYEILVFDLKEKKFFKTNTYISKGKICSVNPNNSKRPNIQNSLLTEVLKDDNLRVFRPEIGLYIYQYNMNLYWIVDESFYFEEDGSTKIEYQLYTTQIQRLPNERQENEWYWDNLQFIFEERQIYNNKEYKVARYKVPNEYSIIKISTGYFKNEMVWEHSFRPAYDLK